MNIAIVGFDIEGRSTYEFFNRQGGHAITILDQSTDIQIPEGANSAVGQMYLNNLDRFDLIVRTAGLPPHKIFEANPDLSPDKVTTQINEFFKATPTRNIIGVTGTKGKGTTSTLITKMLQAAGKDAHLAGNIGIPALDLLPKLTAESWVVLELSSFQLIDLKQSPIIGVCLMVVPEHLNWHADMDEYITAKSQLFAHQRPEDIAIYFAHNNTSRTIAEASNGTKIPFFEAPGAYVEGGNIIIDGQTICPVGELKLLGEHNWQNACAAVTAAWHVTWNIEAIKSVLTNFSGLPYRLEFVADINGVRYYNDSFGTTPETAIAAIRAFHEPVVVILGGSDKGVEFDELAQTVAHSSVHTVVLIGDMGPKIKDALERAGFHNTVDGGGNMHEIVQAVSTAARPGDVALLSTGCASFDMFANYKDRGNQFREAVQALAKVRE